MANLGKRLNDILKGLDRTKEYALSDAAKQVKDNAKAKFDESIDLAINLNVDVRKADQLVRGMMQLPHGTGKSVRVCVIAKGPKAEEAKKAGADIVGADDVIESIQKGEINFDRAIATPDMMGLVGRVAKILGPRGLMPNPKLGTVTLDVAAAVNAAKAGQVEYRTDKAGILHAPVGKASFDAKKLVENIQHFFQTVEKARPAGVKGTFVKKVSLSSTMGPGLIVDISSLRA